ncbi:MAG: Ig-like domain-containing protein [FCB group bacterium]|nr:Ig-like domain-containing protein [FCB group bacterium]
MINKLVIGAALLLIAVGCNIQHHDAAPELRSVTPADGATAVATDAEITVTFSESMDSQTCEERFSLFEGVLTEIPGEDHLPVPGTFSWNGRFTAMTFHPETPLDENTDYSIVMLEGMQGEHDHDDIMMDHDHDGGMMSHDMDGFGHNAGTGIIVRFKTQ